jgi:glycosyltransferase involved in cell wall biosynthesis
VTPVTRVTRPRVLLVEQFAEIGGGQTMFLQSLDALVSQQFDVAAAFPLDGGLEAAVRQRFGDRVPRHEIPEPVFTRGSKELADVGRILEYSGQLFARRDLFRGFDFVAVNGARLFPAFLGISSVVPARFTYHVHLDHSAPEKAIVGALLGHPRTHAVVAASEFVRRRLVATLGGFADRPRLRVIENSLSRELSAAAFTDRWDADRALHAVTIGQIMPEKGQELIVDLAQGHADIHFHLIGGVDPANAAFAERLRARAGANVTFHGRVDNVPAKLQDLGAQLNLVPSLREESFGLAAIEGMASSCLTITSGRGGLADIAARSGAWTATTRAEWDERLGRIRTSATASLVAAAREQHLRTLEHYGVARYDREITALFE